MVVVREGPILLGFKESEDVEDKARDDSVAFLPTPLPPRARFGVADRDPGGVSPGDKVPDPAFVVVIAAAAAVGEVVVVLVAAVVRVAPNNSSRLSSYLRCFSSRSLAARALCSSIVGFFFSSPSSEETSPLASSDTGTGAFLDSNIGGGLKSAFGTPRVSRK